MVNGHTGSSSNREWCDFHLCRYSDLFIFLAVRCSCVSRLLLDPYLPFNLRLEANHAFGNFRNDNKKFCVLAAGFYVFF